MSGSSERQYPPFELASRVFRLDSWSDPYRAYEELGAQTREAIVRLLPDDWRFKGKRVLDFGSGAGRTLRHFLEEAEEGDFWGADLDEASIDWLERELSPPLHGWRSAEWPPLGLEHGSFDLIWAVSVFTHLTDNASAWLLELQRLLKPDGLLIATYMGRWNSQFFASEPWDEDRVGRNVLYHVRDWESGGPGVLMSDWWMREHWGRAFEVLEVEPQIHNMSWALLRKRDVELTTEDLERPGDDPREFAAVRHNLYQVQREVAELTRRLRGEGALREQQERLVEEHERRIREYEESLSWRATRPIRTGASLARSIRSRD
jgi:SAM-dependent methyltransferase